MPGLTIIVCPPPIFDNAYSTDDQGCYRIDRRLPTGTYQISAWRPVQDGNPFQVLLQMRNTQRNLVIEPGQEKVEQNFAVSRQ